MSSIELMSKKGKERKERAGLTKETFEDCGK